MMKNPNFGNDEDTVPTIRHSGMRHACSWKGPGILMLERISQLHNHSNRPFKLHSIDSVEP